MDLIEALLEGRELRDPRFAAPQPVDFIVTSENDVMVFLSGWWMADWAVGNGVEVFPNAVLEKDGAGWRVEGRMPPEEQPTISHPSDGDMEATLSRARKLMDLRRGDYMDALYQAVDQEADFDFAEWTEAILERPKIDPLEEHRKIYLGDRKIGSISVSSGDNEVADVLVLDNSGDAATAQGNPWLESIAERWSEMEDRPDLEAFLSWVADQRSYGPFGLSDPRVFSSSGDVEEIAQRLFQKE